MHEILYWGYQRQREINNCSRDIDFVIHAAALKQVPTAEYNPIETIKTNIIGAQNLIESSLKNEVKKLLLYQQIKQVHQLICMEQPNSAR